MNILITGGTGLIGKKLVELLRKNNHNVRILTRKNNPTHPYYYWDKNIIDEKVFANLDGIIHLAGAPLLNKWTEKYKKEIINSRVETANLLYQYVKKNNLNLKFFISASGAAFYGQNTTNKVFTENDDPGDDYLAEVCILWEKAAYQFNNLNTRVVCVRTPLVLSKEAKAYKLMALPTKFGLGACLGSGKQWMSWIHINDLCNIYANAVENINLKGSINASADEQETQNIFMKKLARSFSMPFFLPNIPTFIVKKFMGEASCIILDGSKLNTNKLKNNNIKLLYNNLETVFKDLR